MTRKSTKQWRASFSLLRIKKSKSQAIKSAVVIASLVTKDLSSLVGQLCEAGSERLWAAMGKKLAILGSAL